MYTSSGLSRHKGTTPTFTTATWLNNPIYVEVSDSLRIHSKRLLKPSKRCAWGVGLPWQRGMVLTAPPPWFPLQAYNVSDSGEFMWSFASSNNQATFQVDMARHAVTYGAGAIDTVAAEANFVAPSNCAVLAFNSLVSTGVPAWNFSVPNCDSSLLYDSDRFIDISDDGSVVAFSGWTQQGASNYANLWVFEGQSGKLLYNKNLGDAQNVGGPVQTSENGTYIAWTSGDSVIILEGTSGAVRDTM